MPGFDPGRPVRGEPTGGDEQMGMGVILERAGPGVQHRQDTGRAADPLRIPGQFLHGGRRFAEERGVDHARVGARHGAEFGREREGEEIVIARQEPLPGPRQPVLRAILLTLGTMPVATGVVVILDGATLLTARDRAAQGGRATGGDIVQRAPLGRPQTPGVRLPVRRPRRADNVRELQHRSVPPDAGPRRLTSAARSLGC